MPSNNTNPAGEILPCSGAILQTVTFAAEILPLLHEFHYPRRRIEYCLGASRYMPSNLPIQGLYLVSHEACFGNARPPMRSHNVTSPLHEDYDAQEEH